MVWPTQVEGGAGNMMLVGRCVGTVAGSERDVRGEGVDVVLKQR